MKKKIILSAGVVFITAVTIAAFVYEKSVRELPDFFKANVEALTNGEAGGNPCYNTITSADGQKVNYCPTCTYIPGKPVWYAPEGAC